MSETRSASGAVRLWLAAGAGVALVLAAYGAMWLFGSHPDATLRPTARPVGSELTASLLSIREYGEDIDMRTLASYETFRGIEPWSAVDYFGDPCLVLLERATGAVLDVACAPGEADLLADAEAWPALDRDFADGLPDGSVIRFQLEGDSVDVFVHRAPASD